MRTSVNIQLDALELARQHAKERDLTLGKAIGELERKGAARGTHPERLLEGCHGPAKAPGRLDSDA